MPPSWKRSAGAGLGYIVALVVLFPALLRFAAIDLPDEFLEFHVAGMDLFGRGLARGEIAAWNPWKLGGMSIFADPPALGPYYPFAPLLLLPLDAAVLLAWLAHLPLGALGIHTLTRRLGAAPAGATAAGLIYLASTPVVAAVVDGQIDMLAILALLPWALVLLQGMPSLAAGAGAGLCMGFIGLGAHTRFAAIAFVVAGLWGLLQVRRPHAGRTLAALALCMTVGGLVCAPWVLPAVLEVQASRGARPEGYATLIGQALSPAGLAGLLYPRGLILDHRWYHIGPALLLAGVAGRRAWAPLGLGAFLLLLGMGSQGPLGWIERPIHWLLYPVETGVAALAVPLLAVAAGLGVDAVAKARLGVRPAIAVAAIGAATLAVGWTAASAMYVDTVVSVRWIEGQAAVIGAVGLAATLAAAMLPRRRTAALLAVVAVTGVAYARSVQVAIPSESSRPSAWMRAPAVLADRPVVEPPERTLQWPPPPIRGFAGSFALDAETAAGHGWGHGDQNDPVADVLRHAWQNAQAPIPQNHGGLAGYASVGGRAKVPPMPWSIYVHWLAENFPQPPAPDLMRGRLNELLHIDVVVSPEQARMGWPGATEPEPVGGAVRRIVSDPRPKALLSTGVVVAPDAVQANALLLGSVDLRSAAVVGPEAGLDAQISRRPPAALVVADWAEGSWSIDLPPGHGGGVVTVAERHHPGWLATLDGEPTPVIQANLVQVGVPVPAGSERLELRFVAPGAATGRGLGALGLVLAGLALRLGRRKT